MLIVLGLVIATPAPSIAELSPETIFERARMEAGHRCQARLRFHVVVTATVNGKMADNGFSATYDGTLDALDVSRFDDQELAHPSVPHGTKLEITLTLGSGGGLGGGSSSGQTAALNRLSDVLTQKLNHDGPSEELLGVPRLSPDYTFGLRASPAAGVPTAEPSDAPTFGLRVIGETTSTHIRDYEVTLAGTEEIGGTEVYHLRLAPRRDPARYRLRDLWVDSATYEVVEIVTNGNFVAGPPLRALWRTAYRDVSGCRVIDRETALAPLDYGPNRIYHDTTLNFVYAASSPESGGPSFTFHRPLDHDDVVEPAE